MRFGNPRSLIVLLCGVACSGADSVTEPPKVTSVAVSPSATTLASGGTLQLVARVSASDGKEITGRSATWSVIGTAATISPSGLLSAGSVLSATSQSVTVTASVEGVSGTATISIEPVPVATVIVSAPQATLPSGTTSQLTVRMLSSAG